MKTVQTVICLLICSGAILAVQQQPEDQAGALLKEGRRLFYASVEDKSKLDSAFAVFNRLEEQFAPLAGRAVVYRGALTALRGRHATWVYTKYNLVKKGLSIMDDGLDLAPNDIEALFIHGSTCHFMPFLFGRGDDAQQDFHRIMELLPNHYHEYEPQLVSNVIEFLQEETKVSTQQDSVLRRIKGELTAK